MGLCKPEQAHPVTRLWTFQPERVVLRIESGKRFLPSWDSTQENWRSAYEWMASRMHEKVGFSTDAPPVWCWHSCGELGKGPTVGTARALLSDREIEQTLYTLELRVPSDLVLLSSYSDWNELLDHVVDGERVMDEDRWAEMFSVPPLKHDDDDIQAAIPYIEPDWVTSVRPLTIDGRD